MNKVELLAPAKNKKNAIAAIEYGCDALYIAAENFGARQNAGNSIEDIREIVEYAHKFNVKVHVTINTILDDNEIIRAKKLIQNLYDTGIDAIIIQDMGILKAAIEHEIPPIPIHISTQCDNRLLEKIMFFDNMGVSRIILARELYVEQIKKICKNTKTEIETFIHGALCVSYSGQCYMSCANGGRSANRGECAQSCRKKYSLLDENHNIIAKDLYLLSLKDFNASKHLQNLIKAGVKSFKIEGRLKEENYVKNTVAFYRQEIDKYAQKTSSGKIFYDFIPDVNKSFNRGFTDYFLEKRQNCYNFNSPKSLGEELGKINKIGKDFFEIKAKINPQDGLCYYIKGELCGCLVNKVEGDKVFPNKMDKLTCGTVIYRNFDAKFEKQLSLSKTKRRIAAKFVYNEKVLHAIDEDENEVAMEVLQNETPKNKQKMEENFINQLKKAGDSDFYITNVEILDEIPFLPISEINNLRRAILDKLMEERLNNYEHDIQQPIKYVEYPIKNLNYKANIHNHEAKSFYENCGCENIEMSYELTKPRNAELMRTKHCLKYAFNMCKSPKKLFLKDEKGKIYPLIFDCKNCEMIITG